MTTIPEDDVTADLGSGDYLRRESLPPYTPIKLRITAAAKEHYDAKDNRPAADKWVVSLEDKAGTVRKMSLNKTNLRILSNAYGTRTSGWIGQLVEVLHDPNVLYAGRVVGGLRLQIPAAAAASIIGGPAFEDSPTRAQLTRGVTAPAAPLPNIAPASVQGF